MTSLSISPGLRFYREVCRCIPFLIDQFDVAELTDKRTLRRVVAERFAQNKDYSNPDTVDMLILKGRQELEEIMQRYKNRHHVINQWITDPLEKKRAADSTANTGFSPWLEHFLDSNYAKPNPV